MARLVGRVTPVRAAAWMANETACPDPSGHALPLCLQPRDDLRTLQHMDLPVRQKLPHTIPQWVAEGSWFFVTINCVPLGKNQLCRPDTGDAVLAAMRFNHERFVWHCRLCVLMPDHLHAIMAFPQEPGMAITIKNWKKFVAGKHRVDWQRDFFDHRLRDHYELDEKTSYILMYPVRKGLCEQPEDWVWIYRPNDRPPPRW